jgi:hypothetical protein
MLGNYLHTLNLSSPFSQHFLNQENVWEQNFIINELVDLQQFSVGVMISIYSSSSKEEWKTIYTGILEH